MLRGMARRAWTWAERRGYPAAWAHVEPRGLFDPSEEVFRRNARLLASRPPGVPRSVLWFVPPMASLYGGNRTILDLMAWLARDHGMRVQVAVVNLGGEGLEASAKSLAEAGVARTDVHPAGTPEDVAALPDADVAVATSWPTAYALLHYAKTGRKFYFLQDFEPWFFSAGLNFGLASATHGFGFSHICNTPGLRSLVPGDDAIGLHLPFRFRQPPAKPKEDLVVFYGRPNVPRNAFSLGIAALRHVKEAHPDWRIVSFGERWDPKWYALDGVVENLGFAGRDELQDTLARASVGLTLTFTPSPALVNQEFFAHRIAVVTNDNPWTSWLFEHGRNAVVAPPFPGQLAAGISSLIRDPARRRAIAEAGHARVQQHDFANDQARLWAFLQH